MQRQSHSRTERSRAAAVRATAPHPARPCWLSSRCPVARRVGGRNSQASRHCGSPTGESLQHEYLRRTGLRIRGRPHSALGPGVPDPPQPTAVFRNRNPAIDWRRVRSCTRNRYWEGFTMSTPSRRRLAPRSRLFGTQPRHCQIELLRPTGLPDLAFFQRERDKRGRRRALIRPLALQQRSRSLWQRRLEPDPV